MQVAKDDMKLLAVKNAYQSRLNELERVREARNCMLKAAKRHFIFRTRCFQIHSKREAELTKLHETLNELHTSMNTEVAPEFVELGSKFTLQRISEYKAAVAEQQSEVSSPCRYIVVQRSVTMHTHAGNFSSRAGRQGCC